MRTTLTAFALAAIATLGLDVTSASAQQATIGSLLEDGFEIKGVTSASLEAGNNTDSVFIILQKDTQAFGCVLRTINSSFCQRMQ